MNFIGLRTTELLQFLPDTLRDGVTLTFDLVT